MLGYMMFRRDELKFREYDRYRAFYCGLCHAIASRCGASSRLALSFEMTFLAMLLTSLYDEEPVTEKKRCLIHPLKKRQTLSGSAIEYCADLSALVSWYDLKDGWEDERRIGNLAASELLKRGAQRAGERYPRQRGAVEEYIRLLHEAEERKEANLDYAANLTGNMLAELYVMREDMYAEDLRILGFAVGKFIYLCDSFEDLERDVKKGSYNPLLPYSREQGFSADCERMLSGIMQPGAQAFERLPVITDAEIMRNILYSGMWQRFERARQKREGEKP